MEKVVISLGGSRILQDYEVDVNFLERFKKFINTYLDKGYKFGIITGGGTTASIYVNAAGKLKFSDDQKDLLGIKSTKLNALLISFLLGKDVSDTFEGVLNSINTQGLGIGGGTTIGHTTDLVASKLASEIDGEVLNLTDVAGVYDKDPRKNPDAELIKEMTWSEFLSLSGSDHKPALEFPFEPKAAELCSKEGIKVGITNSLKEADKFLKGEPFRGTLIE